MLPANASLYDLRYRLSAEDALYNLRYALAGAIEFAAAFWLLSEQAQRAIGPESAWLAYLLLFGCVIGLLVGFFWYWIWFAQRGAGIWYLAGVTFIVGIGLLSAAAWFRDAEENLLLSGAVVVQIPLCGLLLYGCGAWCAS
jgi:hypothetical protein